jgi:hypothetical protein
LKLFGMSFDRLHAPPPFFLEQHEDPNGCALYRFPDVAVFTRLALLVFGTARMDNAGASCVLGRSGAAHTNIFFTIGHSTRTIVEFADLLRESDADFVIDVRSIPRSRTNPQFNRETLQGTLEPWQIGYEHISELGGLRGKSRGAEPSPNAYWRVRSFRNYADYALTAPFAIGLARLRERGGSAVRDHVRRSSLVALPPPDHRRLTSRRRRASNAHSREIACRCGELHTRRRCSQR